MNLNVARGSVIGSAMVGDRAKSSLLRLVGLALILAATDGLVVRTERAPSAPTPGIETANARTRVPVYLRLDWWSANARTCEAVLRYVLETEPGPSTNAGARY